MPAPVRASPSLSFRAYGSALSSRTSRPSGVGRVPDAVRELRRRVLEANGGGRLDDVEFTFRTGGRARTLGEATLRNRVKSHPDVGERWYPDILADIREEQRLKAETAAGDTNGYTAAPGAARPRLSRLTEGEKNLKSGTWHTLHTHR